jgi:hypothetical protein
MSLSLNPKHLKLYKEILRLLVKHGRGELVKDAPLFDDSLEGAPAPPVPAEAKELASDLEKAWADLHQAGSAHLHAGRFHPAILYGGALQASGQCRAVLL